MDEVSKFWAEYKTIILIGAGAVIAWKLYGAFQDKATAAKFQASATPGTPEFFARKIRGAGVGKLGSWVSVSDLMNIAKEIPCAKMTDVTNAYNAMYADNLIADIDDVINASYDEFRGNCL